MAPLVAKGPTATAATAADSEKRAPPTAPGTLQSPLPARWDPAQGCCGLAATDPVQEQAFSTPCALLQALEISKLVLHNGIGLDYRLLYPFYEQRLSRKNKYMAMGYSINFRFHVINAFQSHKLGSHLLKAYHLQGLMLSNYLMIPEAGKKREPFYN